MSTKEHEVTQNEKVLPSPFQSTGDSCTNLVVDLDVDVDGESREETTNLEEEEDEEEDHLAAFQKKKRKKTSNSKVWNEFKEIDFPDGVKKAECRWCKTCLKITRGGATTHFLRHLHNCPARQLADAKQRKITATRTGPELNYVVNFKYDNAKMREALAHMVLIMELPFTFVEHDMFNIFCRTGMPQWQRISRNLTKQDCVTCYEIEKKKIKSLLKHVTKVSITTDMWRSNAQTVEYMVITGHFIHDWELHKRVLNFVHVPPPISGVVVADSIYKCLVEWGIEEKVTTVTVDNAKYNDVALRVLKDNLATKNKLSLDGKLFHVRCTAHIINLLVQEGIKEIGNIIDNVRKSVKYIVLTEARLAKFSDIKKQLRLPNKKLILDCSTRWNSTYLMLATALEFKEVFPRYQERDPGYSFLPSPDEWEKVEKVCEFLEVFNDVTNIISESDYPTSNLFLSEVWRVKEVLNEKSSDDNPLIKAMALRMAVKFDKYWGECNLLMALGAVLDPRYKMMLVKYSFHEIYPEWEASTNITMVRDTLSELYNEYASYHVTSNAASSTLGSGQQAGSSNNTTSRGKNSGKLRYESYVRQVDTVQPTKSDLDVYLEEGVYICDRNADDHFDALDWWKANQLKFRILSKMANDILSIPITSVASESAFSAGGRVIDPYRASLSTDTVQVLLCGADWVCHSRGIKKVSKKQLEEYIQDFTLP